jgi:hypothetical protein
MVVDGPHPAKGRCAGETSLLFGARPWCDVPAAASNFKPAPRVSCGAGASALAVSREEARHSSLLRVRVVPRWLWSALTLPKDAVTARYSSPSARGRGATCQLRPPTPSQRRVSRAAQARRCSLSFGRRRSTRAFFTCAQCRDGCGRSLPCQRALRRRDVSSLRRTTVVRRVSCGLQLQASTACLAQHRGVGARCLWGRGAAL